LKNSDIQKLRKRDDHCWDCGATENLVPHHRANRGMGGSKIADNLQNVILVCAQYNGLMESDSATANRARDLGHKLSKFDSPAEPCFDNDSKIWYQLDLQGGKVRTEPPSYLI
jgi:hypothetical protein